MLITTKCPHTGITNIYSEIDPHMAVGSIARQGAEGFTWRCYGDGPAVSGSAPDLQTAQERLTRFLVTFEDGRENRRYAS